MFDERVEARGHIFTGLLLLKSNNFPEGPISLDCEMVGVGTKRISALGRASIVDYNGNTVYDVFSRPDGVITDFRTPYSGIRPRDMATALSFLVVRSHIQQIIMNRVVVGHSLKNDFEALKLNHPQALIRDTNTAPYAKRAVRRSTKKPVALRDLYFDFFGERIQQGEHCSVEDARATMKIYRQVEEEWEDDLRNQFIKEGSVTVRGNSPKGTHSGPAAGSSFPVVVIISILCLLFCYYFIQP